MKSMSQILGEMAETHPSEMSAEQREQNIRGVLGARGIRCPECMDLGTVPIFEKGVQPDKRLRQVCSVCGGIDTPTPESVILERAGLTPVVAQLATFETWDDARNPALAVVMASVRSWVDAPFGGLILTGPNGVGKTHLAMAAAQYLIQSGLAVRYYESRRLVDKLRAAVADGNYADELRWLREGVGVLIVDDWGAERVTEFSGDALEDVLASRYEFGRPFIVTTNTGPRQWGDRLTSRFSDRSRCTVHICDGADVRPMLDRVG